MYICFCLVLQLCSHCSPFLVRLIDISQKFDQNLLALTNGYTLVNISAHRQQDNLYDFFAENAS